ncbi:hypothetical protein SAMN05660909_05499 [Chitinophaga terrae (ex Kim and Jung 2007)]|uniref:Universal stress protein n=1 Tax=Chitinophaga terrae (ex Kim and Jung 2007) TaxID=408074 RepID=A0A1H4GLX9_9BACT|nr:hypothetical protein [Chitinophaga terrae (ex Kim and Jung 2007)]GEP93589.1 hypothetical protein CTE07_52340 [Chitinophaga terrae (ex Kim and Jung 2007)]SEB10606.1 hypothetical protein SAMN05660909_05499 [Chitinophaga terrae (ex Kim and Jung 2007)]
MKKVLLAIDGDNFSEGAFEFARKMNEQEPICLTGVFLPELNLSGNLNYTSVFVSLIEIYGAASLERSIATFKQQCLRYGIEFRMHSDLSNFGIPELKKETRFADLLLLGHEKFYKDPTLYGTDEFLGSALHNAECPVVAVPEHFTFPESVVLTYDGEASSTHAIKSFAYLFPQLCNRRTILVYGTSSDRQIPEIDEIKELAGHHYSNIEFYRLNADPRRYFDTWLEETRHPIVVSGAYGRTGISRTFRRSFVHEVMRDHILPIYIDHF